jgi:hypothetical protein
LGIISFLMMLAICLTESPIGVAARFPLPSIRFVMAASKAADVSSPFELLAALEPDDGDKNFDALEASLLAAASSYASTGPASGPACAATKNKLMAR